MIGTTSNLSDLKYQLRGVIMGCVDLGATFVKYDFDNESLYLIVPKSSKLYNSKRGVLGIKKALEISTEVKKLLVKTID